MTTDLSPGLRSALTLGGATVLLLAALLWGWGSLTAPFPVSEASKAACVDHEVAKGETVRPEQVTVSVLNAGRRAGLASRSMAELVDAGFHKGSSGNAPRGTRIKVVQIWAADPRSPAVKLLASRLGAPGTVSKVRKSVTQPGIVVVVGDGFKHLRKGVPGVKATAAARVCGPATS